MMASPGVSGTCGDGLVTLPDDTPWSDRMCIVADQAVFDLAACNLPLTEPVTVRLVEAFPIHCVGVFHCGEGLIEILNPTKMDTAKAESPLFAPLDTERYFESILYHELVHAA